jgi:hypothetical protein
MKSLLFILLLPSSFYYAGLLIFLFFSSEFAPESYGLAFTIFFFWGAINFLIFHFYRKLDWNDDFLYLLLLVTPKRTEKVMNNAKNKIREELISSKEKLREEAKIKK